MGTVPDEATTEVYIAPQQSQKRKSKGKGKEKEKEKDQPGDMLSSLTLLSDARSKTLEDLQLQHGEALRVAVDAETSFAAIIGSHIRVRSFFFSLGSLFDTCMRTAAKVNPNGLYCTTVHHSWP